MFKLPDGQMPPIKRPCTEGMTPSHLSAAQIFQFLGCHAYCVDVMFDSIFICNLLTKAKDSACLTSLLVLSLVFSEN